MSVLLDDRDGLDLDAGVARETGDLDSCTRRWVAFEVPAIEFVHDVIVGHIREEHCRFKNVIDVAAGGFENGAEIPKDLLSLRFNPALYELACLRINSDLPRSENQFPGHDGGRKKAIRLRAFQPNSATADGLAFFVHSFCTLAGSSLTVDTHPAARERQQ